MRQLFEIDLKDYQEDDMVVRRPSARAIIMNHTIFEQENFYFRCECEEDIVGQNLDEYEQEAEFVLRYVDIDEAIRTNSAYRSEDYFDEIMIKREKSVLELVRESVREVK